jgi:oxygen-independent coproporphyrinogen-3 oxidase
LCEPVFAFGVSAHSFDGKNRYANVLDTNQYVQKIENGESVIFFNEEIDLPSEFIFLRLRLSNGLNLQEYTQLFDIDLQEKFADNLLYLADAELIEFENNYLKLTKKGMVFSNEVFEVFV